MNLTAAELRALLPHASEELVALNCQEKTDSSPNLSNSSNSSARELALNRGRRMGKASTKPAKVVKDTVTEGPSQGAKATASRGGQADSIRLAVGPLPKACSKNARVHWSTAAKAAKTFRCDVSFACYGLVESPWPHITVDLLLRKRRLPARLDPDNVWSMFKPGLDGLVDAGVVEDDDTKHVALGTITTEKANTDETVITVWER